MTIDLTAAAVRPAGSAGLASRTAAGFILLGSDDSADHVRFVEHHQADPDLIERLAERIPATPPRSLAMLFTAGGEPWLLAWGEAVAAIASPAMRFSISAVAGEVLVHRLSIDDTARIVLSDGPLDDEPSTAPINLTDGSMRADAVVIDLVAEAAEVVSTPAPSVAPAPDAAPVAEPEPEPAAPVFEVPPLPADDEVIVEPNPTPPFGQPAAEGIVFADDLDEISDLIDDAPAPASDAGAPDAPVGEADSTDPLDVPVVPDTTIIRTPSTPAPPVMPATGTMAEIPPEFLRNLEAAEEPAAAAPAAPVFDPAATAPVPAPGERSTPPSLGPVLVLGITCPNGHHNHPEAAFCSTCGTKMGVQQTTVLVNGPRPSLGVLVADDGSTFALDGDLVIGRDPAAHDDVRAGLARPMVLSDDTLSMSRRHARILLEDWTAYVTDLGSSNGTWVSRDDAGQEWSNVAPTQMVALQPGDRLRMGGRVVQVELHHLR